MNTNPNTGSKMLLCQAGSVVCALYLESVAETMRPLPIEPIRGMPDFVSGLSIVRGAPVPVVDLAKLLGDPSQARSGRLVLVNLGERRVALSVTAVMGIRTLDPSSSGALAPLLGGASAEFISAMSSLDARLLLVLESARILPESAWSALPVAGARA